MILRTFLLTTTLLTRQLHGKSADRSFRSNDYDDNEAKYRFVVALVNKEPRLQRQRCTGTLLSPNWLLTAANCLVADTQVQFDEMDLPFNETNSIRQVLAMERAPTPIGSGPDLGLMFVNAIPMKEYAQLLAVDYKAIVGHVVVFAGFGPVENNCTGCVVGQLLLGEGVLSSCNKDETIPLLFAPVPTLCVAPKCSERKRKSGAGEPGSPLFLGGKVAGVHMGDRKPGSMRSYIPVSPYLAWIHRVVAKPEIMTRSGVDVYFPKQYGETMYRTM